MQIEQQRSNVQYFQSTQAPLPNNLRKEIGDQAIWTLSSAKAGNGVEQIRDDNLNTFWQSDGTQPHYINIQFLKKMRIQEISIYLDFKQDESYTPNRISIRAGTNIQDVKEVMQVDLKEPYGWYTFPLKTKLLNGQEKYIICLNDKYTTCYIAKSAQWKRHSHKIGENIWTKRKIKLRDKFSRFQKC
ncbi:hypothetical protein pb186bvf_012323 [Paramecium bursaria]